MSSIDTNCQYNIKAEKDILEIETNKDVSIHIHQTNGILFITTYNLKDVELIVSSNKESTTKLSQF